MSCLPEKINTIGDLKKVLEGMDDDIELDLWLDYNVGGVNLIQVGFYWSLPSPNLSFYVNQSDVLKVIHLED